MVDFRMREEFPLGQVLESVRRGSDARTAALNEALRRSEQAFTSGIEISEGIRGIIEKRRKNQMIDEALQSGAFTEASERTGIPEDLLAEGLRSENNATVLKLIAKEERSTSPKELRYSALVDQQKLFERQREAELDKKNPNIKRVDFLDSKIESISNEILKRKGVNPIAEPKEEKPVRQKVSVKNEVTPDEVKKKKIIKVKSKISGKIGTVPANLFNPNKFTRIE